MTETIIDDDLTAAEVAKKEPSREEVINELNDLNSLIKSAGWSLFVEICNDQRLRRHEQLLLDPLFKKEGHPFKAVMESEFTKGEYEGIKMMLTYPSIRISVLEDDLELLRSKEPKDGTEC